MAALLTKAKKDTVGLLERKASAYSQEILFIWLGREKKKHFSKDIFCCMMTWHDPSLMLKLQTMTLCIEQGWAVMSQYVVKLLHTIQYNDWVIFMFIFINHSGQTPIISLQIDFTQFIFHTLAYNKLFQQSAPDVYRHGKEESLCTSFKEQSKKNALHIHFISLNKIPLFWNVGSSLLIFLEMNNKQSSKAERSRTVLKSVNRLKMKKPLSKNKKKKKQLLQIWKRRERRREGVLNYNKQIRLFQMAKTFFGLYQGWEFKNPEHLVYWL